MTKDRRSALVQLTSMLRSAHGQLSLIYRAEQAEVEEQAVDVEAGEPGDISFACQSMSWLEHYNYYTGVSKIWTAQLSAG